MQIINVAMFGPLTQVCLAVYFSITDEPKFCSVVNLFQVKTVKTVKLKKNGNLFHINSAGIMRSHFLFLMKI